MSSTPQLIARAIADNLLVDVKVAQGAVTDLQHAYTGDRKKYDWQGGAVAIVELRANGEHETRYTLGGGGARRRIEYRPRITLIWPERETLDSSTDHVVEAENFETLIENVKASLRKHTSLGGTVLKCAEQKIEVSPVRYELQNIPHRVAEIHFEVLDEIVAAPTG